MFSITTLIRLLLSFTILNIWSFFYNNCFHLVIPLSVSFLGLFLLTDYFPHYGFYFPVFLHAWQCFNGCQTCEPYIVGC